MAELSDTWAAVATGLAIFVAIGATLGVLSLTGVYKGNAYPAPTTPPNVFPMLMSRSYRDVTRFQYYQTTSTRSPVVAHPPRVPRRKIRKQSLDSLKRDWRGLVAIFVTVVVIVFLLSATGLTLFIRRAKQKIYSYSFYFGSDMPSVYSLQSVKDLKYSFGKSIDSHTDGPKFFVTYDDWKGFHSSKYAESVKICHASADGEDKRTNDINIY